MNKVLQGEKIQKSIKIKKNVCIDIKICMIQINNNEQDSGINYFNANNGSI